MYNVVLIFGDLVIQLYIYIYVIHIYTYSFSYYFPLWFITRYWT